MKKKIITITTMTLLCSSFAITVPKSVLASQINSVNSNELSLIPIQEAEDSAAMLRYLFRYDNFNGDYKPAMEDSIGTNIKKVKSTYLNVYREPNYLIKNAGKPKHEKLQSTVQSQTILKNNSSEEQTMSTGNFNKSLTTTVTTTVTNGYKVGAKGSLKFAIPVIGEGNVELNGEYNFSKAGTDTKTSTITYTAPSQNIKVKSKGAVRVTASLQTYKTTGRVDLLTEYNAGLGVVYVDDSGKENSSLVPVGTLTDHLLHRYPNQWNMLQNSGSSNPKVTRLADTGTYEAHYGAYFIITVDEMKDGKPIPSSSYTYKVAPEMKKNAE